MAIITSIALALLAQGPVEAVAGPQADYDDADQVEDQDGYIDDM